MTDLLDALRAETPDAPIDKSRPACIDCGDPVDADGWSLADCPGGSDDLRGRKPRCYIAGPIAGVPDFRERFAAAVPAVEALGYEVVNPCDIAPVDHEGECPPGYDPGEDASGHTSSACFMRADLRALLDCDAIYLLPGWSRSRGATVEHAVAVACGITVLEEKETQMSNTTDDLRAVLRAAGHPEADR
jgi:hypothetical protein